MKPFVHYIPLREDLSDLKETMEWVRDNPSEVKKIAEQGYQFYWDYLSFVQTEKHVHELLWRLSIAAHENGLDRLKYGTGRGIWPAPIFPLGYERGPHGNWVAVDIATELVKEDAALEEKETPLLYLPGQWQGGVAMNKSKVEMKGGERGWIGGY